MNSADLARNVPFPLAQGQPQAGGSGRPALVVAFVLLLFGLAWLLELDATSLVPPVDDIEQLVWSRSLEWGYYKHPPLPTVFMWAAVHLFGRSAWTAYLLGAVFTLGAMAVFWKLLREMRGERHATLALAAALCITFYNGRLYYYNHNTVLLLGETLAAWLCWRAFDQRRLRWWAALGVVLGLGALAKYQVAVTAASVACFWLWQRGWRDAVHRRGALLAALLALVVFAPHLEWLRGHDFGPITYAIDTSLGADLSPAARLRSIANWLADALLNRAFPAFLLLALVAYRGRRGRVGGSTDAATHDPQRVRAGRALLVSWGVVPLAFMPFTAFAFGSELQLEWGTAFLLFVVPCAMELVPRRTWDEVAPRFAWSVFAGLQLLLLAINIATSPVGSRKLVDTHWRTFPAQQLAARIAPEARRLLGGRIAVISGPMAEAGALALELPEDPAVLIDGRFDRSPWLSPATVAACGALELSQAADLPAAQGWRAVGAPFRGLSWRVQPPRRAGACTR